MNRLKRNIEIIKALNHLSPKQYKAVISHSDIDLQKCLCEIIHNVTVGKIPLSKSKLTKLKHHKKAIYKIIGKKTSQGQRKRILMQKGSGIFSILLPAIIGSLVGLIRKK